MYPNDNIFNIYYSIGKRTPFQVKRWPVRYGEESRYSHKGRSFMVERVEPRGKYGKAYGTCLVDDKPDNSYIKECYPEITDGEIPCAGCGEWVLLDVPGADMDEIFPVHKADDVMPFGKYKGKTISEIYKVDPKYIFWLVKKDPYYRIDFLNLIGVNSEDKNWREEIEKEIQRVFPKITVDDIFSFGKYKGQTYRSVYEKDPQYIDWFLRNNRTIDVDYESFMRLMKLNNDNLGTRV